jgi:hypothetical protein
MDSKIISSKLLLISIIVSIGIISYLFLINRFTSSTRLIICNNSNKLTVLIKSKDKDILLNPITLNEALECIGKNMVFYDRTIELAYAQNNYVLDQIANYYKIEKRINSDFFRIGNISISEREMINVNNIIISQKHISSINKDFLDFNKLFIQAENNGSVDNIMKALHVKNISIKDGDILKLEVNSAF